MTETESTAASREHETTEPPLLGAASSPIATAALIACVVGGAVGGALLLDPEQWSLVRRIAGGAVSGFGCWLLVMMGRVIG